VPQEADDTTAPEVDGTTAPEVVNTTAPEVVGMAAPEVADMTASEVVDTTAVRNNHRLAIKSLRFFFYLSHFKALHGLARILGALNVECRVRQVKTVHRWGRFLVCKFGFGGRWVEAYVKYWGAVSRPPSLREIVQGFPERAEFKIFVSSHAVPPQTFKRLFRERVLFLKVNDGRGDLAYRAVPMSRWFRKLRERAYVRGSKLRLFPPYITCDLAHFARGLEPVAVGIKDFLGRQVWFKIYFHCKRLVWLRARRGPEFMLASELLKARFECRLLDRPPTTAS